MIVPQHVRYYDEIFPLPGFLADPILIFGYQDVWMPESGPPFPSEFFNYPDLNGWLHSRGCNEILTLDHFDSRANLQYDMNYPVPVEEHERYGTLIDIGCLEHVFDTRICLENCLRMVRVGGHMMLHTPVNGYYAHGLHVFNPEGILTAYEINGFEIVYVRYSHQDGRALDDPGGFQDSILWVVARKTRSLDKFVCPQQGKWSTRYKDVQAVR